MNWRPSLESCGVLRGGRGIDPAQRDRQRAVEVRIAQEREHVVLEDRLALAVGEEGRLEPGCRIELDLAVFEGRVDVEEDGKAVVEPGATDAPLVDQGDRAWPPSRWW